MGFLTGKRALITGLASDRSIAFGIAEAMRREGAEVALSYVGERFKERVEEMGREIGAAAVYEMDVGSDASIDSTFAEGWRKLAVVMSNAGMPRASIDSV